MDIGELTREQLKVTRDIGHNLKEKRENLGYTLDYVSGVIRISVHTIQQLEEGNYPFFRNMVFLKGTLRNYCNFMKIDPRLFLEEIDKLFIKNTVEEENIIEPTRGKMQTPFFLNLMISFVVVFLISIAVYFFFFNNFDQKSNVIVTKENIENIAPTVVEEEPNEQLVLALRAEKDGWARISINEKKTFEIFLKMNVDYSWIVQENFQVTLATQDLALVFLNQKPAILLLEEEKNVITTFNLNSF